MNKGQDYILPEGVEIKKIKQIMFSNGDGFAYQDIRMAEYAVAIGKMCECGEVIDGKGYIICDKCRDKKQNDKYNSFELVVWDNKTPLTIFNSDIYFFHGDIDEIYNHCEQNNIKIEDLQLVLCEPNSAPSFDLEDYCCDYLPEDFTVSDYEDEDSKHSIAEVEAIVNEFLENMNPVSWSGGSKRVTLKKEKV